MVIDNKSIIKRCLELINKERTTKDNNLKVAIYTMYYDLLNYIIQSSEFLPKNNDLINKAVKVIYDNIREVTANHLLNLPTHVIITNKIKSDIDELLLLNDIDKATLEELNYVNLYNALEDRVSTTLRIENATMVNIYFAKLLNALKSKDYNEETIISLDKIIKKHYTYIAKGRKIDGGSRNSMRESVRKCLSTLYEPALKL